MYVSVLCCEAMTAQDNVILQFFIYWVGLSVGQRICFVSVLNAMMMMLMLMIQNLVTHNDELI